MCMKIDGIHLNYFHLKITLVHVRRLPKNRTCDVGRAIRPSRREFALYFTPQHPQPRARAAYPLGDCSASSRTLSRTRPPTSIRLVQVEDCTYSSTQRVSLKPSSWTPCHHARCACGSYAHQRHFSSELMRNPPLQINTVKCVEGCHMGREGCDRTRARGFGRTGRV